MDKRSKRQPNFIKFYKRIGSWMLIVLFSTGLLAGCQVTIGGAGDSDHIIDEQSFVDDVGNLIEIEELPETIVSLSSMHTENLYYLGKGDLIVGVDQRSNFPYEVVAATHYDLCNDYQLEQLIASDPDLILITPDTNEKSTHIVSVLETGCRKVVSLKPERLSEFDGYIKKLAMLVGAEKVAEEALADYHSELAAIGDRVHQMDEIGSGYIRPTVFVETAERGYETIYEGSPIDEALALIQVEHIPEKNRQPYEGAETAPFGFDRLLEKGEEIDHYFTLQGRAGDGTSPIIIEQKESMQQIRAVRDGYVHELLVPLIDNYTFRYPIGVQGLARQVYGNEYINLTAGTVNESQVLTRAMMADILYDYYQLEPFAVIDSNYYEFEKFHHTFGSFTDVSWQAPDFHQIEAVVMMAYLYPIKTVDDTSGEVVETFDRERAVTRSDLAKLINTMKELTPVGDKMTIIDTQGHPDEKIIQKVMDAGWMTIEDGRFRPDEPVTAGRLMALLEQLN